MLHYTLKRIAIAVPTILILIVLSFALMHSAPGSPFTGERPLPPEVLANLEAKYGLDRSFPEQVARYVWRIVTDFDFGPSYSHHDRTVNEIIAQGFPVTLTYGSLAFLFSILAGTGLGSPRRFTARPGSTAWPSACPWVRRCCPISSWPRSWC